MQAVVERTAIYSLAELVKKEPNSAKQVLILDCDDLLFTVDNTSERGEAGPLYLVGGEKTKESLAKLRRDGVSICLVTKKNKRGAEEVRSKLDNENIAQYVDFIAYDPENLISKKLLEACIESYVTQANRGITRVVFIDNNEHIVEIAKNIVMPPFMAIKALSVGTNAIFYSDQNAAYLKAGLEEASEFLNSAQSPTSLDASAGNNRLDSSGQSTPSTSSSFRRAMKWLFSSNLYLSTLTVIVNPDREKVGNNFAKQHGFLTTVKFSLIRIFTFDGFEPSIGQITSADGKVSNFSYEDGKRLKIITTEGKASSVDLSTVPWQLLLVSFLGLPSRPDAVENGVIKFTFMQFLRNLIGGWNPVKETISGPVVGTDRTQHFFQRRWTEKKIFLGLIWSFKILVILPIKLITWPFKLMLNVVKLATEFLLPVISVIFLGINLGLVDGTKWLAKALIGYNKDKVSGKVSNSFHPLRVFIIIPLILVAAVTLAVGIVQYALVLACRIGLALTSPLKSAQYAFQLGRLFQVGKIGSRPQKVFSMIMSVLGIVLSLSLSAVLWTITLPLALSALVTVIPGIMTAITWVSQLPWVASSLAWLGQLPAITASTALLHSFFGIVGTALATAFGPAVTALATVITIQIPTVVMTVGTTLGLILTPIGVGLSFVADKLSDLWARWVEQAPIASVKASFKELLSFGRIKSEAEGEGVGLSLVKSASVAENSELVKGGTSQPLPQTEVILYQPYPGEEYIIGRTPLYLKRELKQATAEAQKLIEGIKITGTQAEELLERAKNVERKGLVTQGVRFATAEEALGTFGNPAIYKGYTEISA